MIDQFVRFGWKLVRSSPPGVTAKQSYLSSTRTLVQTLKMPNPGHWVQVDSFLRNVFRRKCFHEDTFWLVLLTHENCSRIRFWSILNSQTGLTILIPVVVRDLRGWYLETRSCANTAIADENEIMKWVPWFVLNSHQRRQLMLERQTHGQVEFENSRDSVVTTIQYEWFVSNETTCQ